MLVGENGAGKSTFLKGLLGLYPDFTGKLYRNGAVSRTGIRKNVFALLQDYRLYPATVAENVLLQGMQKRGRAACLGGAAKGRSGRKNQKPAAGHSYCSGAV
ncbi:MAG: ATP-binding cassette domain-containing protein [Gallintestinimicrobium sp.]